MGGEEEMVFNISNKMTRETPEVRSDKRKPREEREEKEDEKKYPQDVPNMSPRCH